MRHPWNRGGPLRVIAGLCLLGPGVAAADVVPGEQGWDCRSQEGSGWHCTPRLQAAEPVDAPAPVPAAAPEPDVIETLAEPDGPHVADSLWLPVSELPPVQAERVPAFCPGAYRVLVFPEPLDTDPESRPLEARAGRATYVVDGDIELEGNVVLVQGNRSATAARATLDQTTREGRLLEGVRLLEPGVAMQGREARMDLDTGAAQVDEVRFLLLDAAMRGEAETVSQDEAGTLTIRRGGLTRCEPGNNNWRVNASSVVVEEDEVFATARNAVVRVKNVPLFYTPYIRFPVTDERQSGWLFPNLGYSDEDGYDVSLPYYLNLAPNYDATLIPRYVSQRGEGMEGEFRHLSGWSETTLSGAFLYRDELYNGTLERDDFEELREAGEVSGEFEPEDRWLYAMDHIGEFGRFGTRVDYTAVSDRDYFSDLGTDLAVSSQIELERRGEISYTAGNLGLRLWAQRFQRLDEAPTDPYQRLPELDLTYTSRLLGPLEWSLGASYVSFDRNNDDLTGLNAAVGDRAHVEPRLRLPFTAPWGFATLSGGYRYTSYDLRDVPDDAEAEPDRGIALGSARAGLFFERELGWFGADLVQTLEPEVYYLYQEYEAQETLPRFDASELTFGYSQLFRDNRFSGLDRIGDANQLSVGVTTRFLDASTGREYLRASLGEIVYFEDRQVTLSGRIGEDEIQETSALAGELSGSLGPEWRVTGTTIYDPNDDQFDEIGAGVQYRRDNRHIFNVGYRKRIEGDIDQTDVSLYWPVTRHLAVMGRWNYDVVSGRTIEGFGGIEYNDCCWRIRVMARRFLDRATGRDFAAIEADEGIYLQIVFKGLAGFGGKIDSVLERGIRGYRTETMDDLYQTGL